MSDVVGRGTWLLPASVHKGCHARVYSVQRAVPQEVGALFTPSQCEFPLEICAKFTEVEVAVSHPWREGDVSRCSKEIPLEEE